VSRIAEENFMLLYWKHWREKQSSSHCPVERKGLCMYNVGRAKSDVLPKMHRCMLKGSSYVGRDNDKHPANTYRAKKKNRARSSVTF
jgi:hypothetical protein